MRSLLRRVFSEELERSVRLRLLALAATWATGFALGWVGASPWVWLGGALAVTAGHAFSWFALDRRLRIWPLLLALPTIGITVVLAAALPVALQGNWLPVAQHLMLLQAIAGFNLRTRGGLYTAYLLNGSVLALAGQLAFGVGFMAILGVFAVLFVAFLASATSRDGRSAALATAPWAVAPRLAIGAGSTVAILVVGALFFVLLPWGAIKDGAGYAPAMLPVGEGTLGPLSPGESAAVGDLGGSAPGGGGQSPTMPGPGDAPGSSEDGPGANAPTGQSTEDDSPGESIDADPSATGPQPRPGAERPRGAVVMQVRSPVASYWRGGTFSRFNGQTWLRDPVAGAEGSGGRGVGASYTQTFYLHETQGTPLLGYFPLEWRSLAAGDGGDALGEGAVYQVVSQRRNLDSATLRRAGGRATALLGDAQFSRSAELARRVADHGISPLDRALMASRYLRAEYEYRPSLDPWAPSTTVDGFLFGGRDTGSAFDFAAAHATLARALGMNARVVIGYLPGEFDHLSGAYTVRRGDAHAWTEIAFPGVGWVPFEPSPRPDLTGLGGGESGASRALSSVFRLRLGDNLRAPLDRAVDALRAASASPTDVAAFLAAVALTVWLALRVKRDGLRRSQLYPYSRLVGRPRGEALRAYRRLETHLERRRIARRAPSETLDAYFGRALVAAPHLREEMNQLRFALAEAAYRPGDAATLRAEGVRGSVDRLRRLLRSHAGT